MYEVAWYNTALPSKLLWLDGWVALPFLLWCVHLRTWTLTLLLLSVVLSLVLHFLSMTLAELFLLMRRRLMGPKISCHMWYHD